MSTSLFTPFHTHNPNDFYYDLDPVFEHANGDVTWHCPKCGKTLRLGEDVGMVESVQYSAVPPKTAASEPIDDVDTQAVSWLGRAIAELAGASSTNRA
jgi:hypothetical protein